jgi:hypothetical protein
LSAAPRLVYRRQGNYNGTLYGIQWGGNSTQSVLSDVQLMRLSQELDYLDMVAH